MSEVKMVNNNNENHYQIELESVEFISTEQLLMGRDREFPLTEQLRSNAATLLKRVNGLLLDLLPLLRESGHSLLFKVSSGYRPGYYNTQAGGAKYSMHLVCGAVDIADPGNVLDSCILKCPDLLQKWQLWLEHPNHTPGWVHLDTRSRPSHVFLP